MGLGKTVQTLALLVHRAALGPALVIAPISVTPGWIAEAARFAPGLRDRIEKVGAALSATDGEVPQDRPRDDPSSARV